MIRVCWLVPAVLLPAALAGCSVPGWGSSIPERRPLGAGLSTYEPAERLSGAGKAPATGPEEPTGPLTLRRALALTLARSPKLASFAWSVRQAEAEQLQAGLYPNPELEAEFENFGGSGEFRGTRALETTILLSQVIELGGKRRKRLELARLDSRLAGWEYEAKRLEVFVEVSQRFAEALAIRANAELARESLRLAEGILATVRKRVAAGKVPPTQETKASVEVATARIRLGRLGRESAAARQGLAAGWGSTQPRFASVAGELPGTAPLPDLSRLVPLLSQNPQLARWATEIRQRQAALALAKAGAIPDVTAGVGYRTTRETEDNDHALVVTVAVPVPILDRNQGEIAKARFAVLKAKTDRRAAEVGLRAKLVEAYGALAAAHAEARSLRSEVLPAARQSSEASRRLFQEGKTGYLDVLDAQRTLTGVRGQHVQALLAYHQARTEVEGLIGQSLDRLDAPNTRREDGNHEK